MEDNSSTTEEKESSNSGTYFIVFIIFILIIFIIIGILYYYGYINPSNNTTNTTTGSLTNVKITSLVNCTGVSMAGTYTKTGSTYTAGVNGGITTIINPSQQFSYVFSCDQMTGKVTNAYGNIFMDTASLAVFPTSSTINGVEFVGFPTASTTGRGYSITGVIVWTV